MVLNDIPDGAGLIIKGAAALNAEILRHRDLNTFDVVAVPERFEKGIGEPEVEHILNRSLPEVMINTEYRLFGKSAGQSPVQFLSRGKVSSEWLFDDDTRACSKTRF